MPDVGLALLLRGAAPRAAAAACRGVRAPARPVLRTGHAPETPALQAHLSRRRAGGDCASFFRARCAAGASAASDDADVEMQRVLAGPRIEAGLDVHRRVHALAGKHPGYLFQWRAFCERQRRDWQDAHGAFDEDILAGAACADICTGKRRLIRHTAQLAVFHFELEKSLLRFESDVVAGRVQNWPQRRRAALLAHPAVCVPDPLADRRRSLHPTQGLPALAAAMRAASEATVGRARLFKHAQQP